MFNQFKVLRQYFRLRKTELLLVNNNWETSIITQKQTIVCFSVSVSKHKQVLIVLFFYWLFNCFVHTYRIPQLPCEWSCRGHSLARPHQIIHQTNSEEHGLQQLQTKKQPLSVTTEPPHHRQSSNPIPVGQKLEFAAPAEGLAHPADLNGHLHMEPVVVAAVPEMDGGHQVQQGPGAEGCWCARGRHRRRNGRAVVCRPPWTLDIRSTATGEAVVVWWRENTMLLLKVIGAFLTAAALSKWW